MSLVSLLAATCNPGAKANPFTSNINLPYTCAGQSELQTALQIVSAVLGAIALLIITINAIRYIISQGDSGQTAKAKNAILYALIGLVISISSYVIVTYVLTNLFPG